MLLAVEVNVCECMYTHIQIHTWTYDIAYLYQRKSISNLIQHWLCGQNIEKTWKRHILRRDKHGEYLRWEKDYNLSG